MRKNLPDPSFFLGKPIPGHPGYVVSELVGSGGNAHVFRAHSDQLNNDMACKVIPRANLQRTEQEPAAWKDEILKANALETPIVVRVFDISVWTDATAGVNCVVLLSPFIRGVNLGRYISANRRHVTVPFVVQFLQEMLAFMYDMERHNVTHGDIKADNILVEDRSGQLGWPPHAFRVTDFGVARATSDVAVRDDYDQLAVVLRDLLSQVDYQAAGASDKFAFNYLNDHLLARHLVERDLTRDPLARRPDRLYDDLRQLPDRFLQKQTTGSRPTLNTLYDYLSCEQIGEAHSLLGALYSKAFLGLPEIDESRSNLVLTGPRGCGKSTVFKCLSLRHRTLVDDDGPETVRYIGVYYRCNDLWLAFPRYRLPERDGALDIPVHFLTCTLLGRVLESIEDWGKRYFGPELVAREPAVADRLWSVIEQDLATSRPQEPGVLTFGALRSFLQTERLRAANKHRFVNDPAHPMRGFFGPGSLLRACEATAAGLSFVAGRPFFFFIDDYSTPSISADLQRNLNRVVMQRSAQCFFKVSTDSPVSYRRDDIEGKGYVEGREFTLSNLGLVYLGAGREAKLRFLADVFARRLAQMEQAPARSLEELVGDYHQPGYNEVAFALRRGRQVELCGQEVLCDLCSGDIFYVIGLVARMVADAGGKEEIARRGAVPLVEPKVQHAAIRQEAGDFLTNLRAIPDGEHLVQIVTAFGNVAHSYMIHRVSTNEEGSPPHLASRIEPYEELNLSAEARGFYDELLRYSLFIEDPRGKSRRGRVVPRLYLRRCLLPHFSLTFGKRDSIQLEPHEMEQLLLQPKEFEESHRLRRQTEAPGPMFDGSDEKEQ